MAEYRRGIFLINRPFQFKFALFVCTWLFALSLMYPMIIYNLFGYFAQYMKLDTMGPALGEIESTRARVFWLLVFFQSAFVVLTFLISIFISHRIAGPLFKLSRFLDQVKAGDLSQDLYFRKKDHFKDLAVRFNEMQASLRRRHEETVHKIESVLPSVPEKEQMALRAAIATLTKKTN